MIKRVILDIDNTLIPWEKEYDKEVSNVLNKLEIPYTEEDVEQILKALSEYENAYLTFDKEKMSEYVNQYTKKQYPQELVYEIIKRWEDCVPNEFDLEIIETLEYLKSKYELVILTDWYADSQKERLKKVGIEKYFDTIYSAEKTKRKPYKEAFMQAIGVNKPEECVMVGDSFERDIDGAINAGLQAIYYNPNNINEQEYKTIAKIKELKEIL